MSEDALKRAREAMEEAVRVNGGLEPLASVCGVNNSTIWRAQETGHVPPRVGIRMHELLGADLRVLMPRYFDDSMAGGDDVD